MRGVYGAIFIGFAVVGFAGVFNAHNSARAATTTATATDDQKSTVQPATNPSPSPITIRTDVVRADVLGTPAPVVMRAARRAVRRPGVPRSRFARVLFGDGQFRPQPFPIPAKH